MNVKFWTLYADLCIEVLLATYMRDDWIWRCED